MSQDRDWQITYAKIAEQAEKYDEMLKAMTAVARMSGELSVEERNLLSVAYKNVVGARRSSWRYLNSIDPKDKDEKSPSTISHTLLQQVVEKELEDICNNILDLLDKNLIPSAKTLEGQVFFYKMKGDYKRYLAEIAVDEKRNRAAEDSLVAYKTASDIANEHLPAMNPVRLGLALNFSVFYYEILNNPKRACELAQTAFLLATEDTEHPQDDNYKDSTLIMRLLRDNLTLWNSDVQEGDEPNANVDTAA